MVSNPRSLLSPRHCGLGKYYQCDRGLRAKLENLLEDSDAHFILLNPDALQFPPVSLVLREADGEALAALAQFLSLSIQAISLDHQID